MQSYGIPSEEIRRLLARLILEETLEAINALGFDLYTAEWDDEKCTPDLPTTMKTAVLTPSTSPNLEKIIDGCADTIYVCTGTMVACGVPDVPHLAEVCRANNDKFPNGTAVIDPKTGKYLKPYDWHGPHHNSIQTLLAGSSNMLEAQKKIMESA